MISYSASSIHFWRTKDGAEIDFIVDTGRETIPVEVKFASLKKPEINRSLNSFISKYRPSRAFIIHLGERSQTVIDSTKVTVMPFGEFILSPQSTIF